MFVELHHQQLPGSFLELHDEDADAVIAAGFAVDLDGLMAYISLDGLAPGLAAVNEWTVSFWTRGDGAVTGFGRNFWNINKDGGSPDNRFTSTVGVGNTYIDCYDSVGLISGTRSQNTDVRDGEWHHVAMSRASGGAFKLYVDGVLELDASSSTMTIAADDLVTFGAEYDHGTNIGNFWDGDAPDLAVWLSVQDLSDLAPKLHAAGLRLNLLGGAVPAPDHAYRFGGRCVASIAEDYVGGVNGTLSNVDASDVITTGLG